MGTRPAAFQFESPAHPDIRVGVKIPGANLDDLNSPAPVAVNEENEMMIKFNHRLRMQFVAALFAVGLVAGFAGSAEASGPSPTPNGWIGACNMAESEAMFGYYSDPPTGPMTHDGTPGLPLEELQGNLGMSRAVEASGGCY